MQVAAPAFKFEWNLNTVVTLVGFAMGFIAWGYTLADLRQGRQVNAENIGRIEMRVERLEDNSHLMTNHELRITNLEKHALETTGEIRAANSTLDTLSSDVRLVTEILRRIELAQKTRDPPPER